MMTERNLDCYILSSYPSCREGELSASFLHIDGKESCSYRSTVVSSSLYSQEPLLWDCEEGERDFLSC